MDIDKIQTNKLDEISTSQQKQTNNPKDGMFKNVLQN